MNLFAIVLIVIGVILIVLSLLNARRPPTSDAYMAFHKTMDDKQIAKQLANGPRRAVAGLGIASGVVFIIVGMLWQVLCSMLFLG